jgi:hypothetical protein
MDNSQKRNERRANAGNNQSAFRDVNEDVAALNRRWGTDTFPSSFVCECPDPNCAERILLAHDEYERLRQNPTRFFVLPGHEVLEVEDVVQRTARYFVVETIGAAADVAAERNTRTAQPT